MTTAVSEVSKTSSRFEKKWSQDSKACKRWRCCHGWTGYWTHVLPDAEVKVFLIASVEERAHRRYQENLQKGFSADIEKLKEEIALRDKLDSEREVSPLRKANRCFGIRYYLYVD